MLKVAFCKAFPCLNTTNIRREFKESKLIKVNEA